MHRTHATVIVRLLALAIASAPAGASPPQDPPYFPETGRGAIHQHLLDLQTPAVVLFVALQPGYEDFPLLADLRLREGARTVVLYLTNGEATPGDDGGALPVEIAARRKEEAYQANLLLGSTPYFLNFPDPGVVPDTAILRSIWRADTVVARIDHALRYFKPDAVIIGGDCRGNLRQSMRQRLLTGLTLRAVHVAADPSARHDSSTPGPWQALRVLGEVEGGKRIAPRSFGTTHPVWKKSYRTIASEASGIYRTLKYQIGSWSEGGDRAYSVIWPEGRPQPPTLLKGLPRAGPESRSFRPLIDRIARGTGGEPPSARLAIVIRAIDSLDVILGRRRSTLPTEEARVLASWKNTLEALRCALLGVRVEYSLSDSLLTRSQLTYLRFGNVTFATDSTRTRIFFPGARNHAWGINETIENQFPFKGNSEYRILTPESLPFTFPMTQFGMTSSVPRARFSFILIHRDRNRARDFIYREETPFHAGPRRTHEVLTPLVRALDGEPVIVRFVNVSRDAYQGTLSLRDSMVASVDHEVTLPNKDFVLIDTVRLDLTGTTAPGEYPMALKLSGGGELPFIMRSFDVRVDSGARVGLLTVLEDGPVEQALRRLRARWEKIVGEGGLDDFNSIIVDREALQRVSPGSAMNEALHAWVNGGGSLVVLPPAAPEASRWGLPGPKFRRDSMLPPSTWVAVDTTDELASTPNRLTDADWDQWVIARTLCGMDGRPDAGARVVVSSAGEHHVPLVITLREGKGRITYVALDLYSQLMNIHPGAHRLLANLIRR